MNESEFWKNVDRRGRDECWPWMACRVRRGYGRVRFGGRSRWAHRIAVKLDGRDPTGMVVRHKCDNPPCCNPTHLLLGTDKDNCADMMRRGRYSHGARRANAKLSDDDIADIVSLSGQGAGSRALAEVFGVSQGRICDVVSGRTWRHAQPGMYKVRP